MMVLEPFMEISNRVIVPLIEPYFYIYRAYAIFNFNSVKRYCQLLKTKLYLYHVRLNSYK